MEDFMTRKWQIERSFFDKEVMGYDPKTKKDVPWPYFSQEEQDHKKWLSEVQNPVTKEFYKGEDPIVEYDNEGKEIPASKKILEKEPYFERTQIIRIRTKDKKEFLYSRGFLHGYTTYKTPISTSFQEPEKWEQTTFKHHMEYIQRENRHREVCDGPSGSITHYTLEFSPENIDKLMENATANVLLIVKEEGGGMVKQCPDLEMFKTKSFDYIKDMGYLTEAKRAEKLEEFQAMQTGTKQTKKS